jgi:hypothetical protein
MDAQKVMLVAGGATVGGLKLVFVGACLAIGFAAGNYAVRKSVETYEGWKYSRLEKKHPEPEKDDANNG